MGNLGCIRKDQCDVLRPAIVGIGLLGKDYHPIRIDHQSAELITAADFQLITSLHNNRLIQTWLPEEVKTRDPRRGVCDHLAAFGEADDDIIDVPTLMVVILAAAIVEEAVIRASRWTVVFVSAVALQYVRVEQWPGVGDRYAVQSHQGLSSTNCVSAPIVEFDRRAIGITGQQRTVGRVKQISPVKGHLRPKQLYKPGCRTRGRDLHTCVTSQ